MLSGVVVVGFNVRAEKNITLAAISSLNTTSAVSLSRETTEGQGEEVIFLEITLER